MTALIEQLAGVAPDSRLGEALKTRAEVLRLSEAAQTRCWCRAIPAG
jgi:hypothetical protein